MRDYESEENKTFMKELNEGYVPTELRKKYNKKIGVALEDKRDKKYRPPTPPAYVAYSGTGMAVADVQGVGGAVNKDAAEGKPIVDSSKPTTNLQIRFHNGERATLTVNMTHTVGDIHGFVMSAAPIDGEY